CQQESTWPMF
nr:immunoglobulin light chain junction region [Macaca mulatta]